MSLFGRLFSRRGKVYVPTTKQVFSGSRAWLQEGLTGIANRAWSETGPPRSDAFLLDPAILPKGTSASVAQKTLSAYYEHARGWAAGLEVPYSVPPVRYSDAVQAAGEFRVDGGGCIEVVLPHSTAQDEMIFRAVLAHEACHHVMGLSGLNQHRTDYDEPVTDLTIFICGLGRVFMEGQLRMVRSDNQWARIHLGYLTATEYGYVDQWCRNACNDPIILSKIQHLQRRLLSRLGGSHAAFERCVAYERRLAPQATESELVQNALERLERDQR